ncbi:unnamed protein product, partial [Amoebophrya sp. A25]
EKNSERGRLLLQKSEPPVHLRTSEMGDASRRVTPEDIIEEEEESFRSDTTAEEASTLPRRRALSRRRSTSNPPEGKTSLQHDSDTPSKTTKDNFNFLKAVRFLEVYHRFTFVIGKMYRKENYNEGKGVGLLLAGPSADRRREADECGFGETLVEKSSEDVLGTLCIKGEVQAEHVEWSHPRNYVGARVVQEGRRLRRHKVRVNQTTSTTSTSTPDHEEELHLQALPSASATYTTSHLLHDGELQQALQLSSFSNQHESTTIVVQNSAFAYPDLLTPIEREQHLDMLLDLTAEAYAGDRLANAVFGTNLDRDIIPLVASGEHVDDASAAAQAEMARLRLL